MEENLLKQRLQVSIHSSIFHKNPNLETTQVSMKW